MVNDSSENRIQLTKLTEMSVAAPGPPLGDLLVPDYSLRCQQLSAGPRGNAAVKGVQNRKCWG